jgi:DNA-binding HxlR family transcriptional regulator
VGTLGFVLGRTYEGQNCSIARTLEVVGERWTLLIVRDALLGATRFDEFQVSLGIARNVLASRLASLVENGIFDRVMYQHRPVRHEYRLTAKGRDLGVVVIALMQWGDKYEAPDGAPRIARHNGCGGRVVAQLACRRCGQRVARGGLGFEAGPGLAAS